MKKGKVFVTAAAIVAIVGTGLAVKANFGTGQFACRATSGICPGSKDYNSSTNGTLMFCGAINSTDCETLAEIKVVSVPAK